MFGRKTKSANDSFLMSANRANVSKAPPKKAEKVTKPQTNLHPSSPRQKLGAIGIPKKHIK